MQGAFRFLRRLWRAVHLHAAGGRAGAVEVDTLDDRQKALRRALHHTTAKVTDDVGRRYTFNTAIAAVMELLNELGKFDAKTPADRAIVQEVLDGSTLMLAPIVPHICHRLWRVLGHVNAAVDERWPVADRAALVADAVAFVVQVNGKVRGHIKVAAGTGEDAVKTAALAENNVSKHIAGKVIKRVIVVPGKLVNVVV